MIVLISSCLLGINCRYDGGNNRAKMLDKMIQEHQLTPVCPEQLGGLPTPREPSNIINGDGRDVLDGKARVINIIGEDVTQAFIKGARETLKIAMLFGVEKAILKARSPSCGLATPYCESNSGSGPGVTAALLISNDIEIIEIDS